MASGSQGRVVGVTLRAGGVEALEVDRVQAAVAGQALDQVRVGDVGLAEGDRVFGALNEWTFRRGTLAEFVAPRADEVALLPSGVDAAHAASVALVGLTALQAFVPPPAPPGIDSSDTLAEDERLTVRLTEREALQEVVIMLRTIEQTRVQVSDKTALPGTATLRLVSSAGTFTSCAIDGGSASLAVKSVLALPNRGAIIALRQTSEAGVLSGKVVLSDATRARVMEASAALKKIPDSGSGDCGVPWRPR